MEFPAAGFATAARVERRGQTPNAPHIPEWPHPQPRPQAKQSQRDDSIFPPRYLLLHADCSPECLAGLKPSSCITPNAPAPNEHGTANLIPHTFVRIGASRQISLTAGARKRQHAVLARKLL